MLSQGIVLLHDNARHHSAGVTRNLIQQFSWEQFDHPPYSPDLAPSDYHLSLNLKLVLEGGALTAMTTQKTVFSSGCLHLRHLSLKRV
ncbi:hypothetical protein AVEN_64989-1 [Araneus ventricosus]|uniref:Histone-lysine N-methyltransferase SETMAR n=1 Tax=Araneus ventricosus TaxID=182803 RepID=A0A4Y2TXW2_ARAVE|nr:hypothetical protein AVEN_64989-1 [Araneus ventricosus]